MKLSRNNKGFSLVEMMTAVTILSIIMAGIAWMLSTMSKSFSNSQKEVQLQDSVQSTYNIVSDLIKESQTISTGDAVPPSVEYDSASNRAYIIDDEKGVAVGGVNNSKFYIVELDTSRNNLYLYTGKLYTDADAATKADYKSVPSMTVTTNQNLLATNVTQFTIDTGKINNGYVILAIKLKYGSREASITQNVYLRNSNMSAEWIKGGDEAPTDELDGYKLVGIQSITCSKSPYTQYATAKKEDFVIIGKYEKEDDPSDTKEAQVPAEDFESPQIGVQLTTLGAVEVEFTFADSEVTASTTISVVGGSVSLSRGSDELAVPDMDKISAHGELSVYYTSQKPSGTKTATVQVPAAYECPNCHGSVYLSDDGTMFYCNDQKGWTCPYRAMYSKGPYDTNVKSDAERAISNVAGHGSYSESKNFKVGAGKFIIKNDSELNDYHNVKIWLYIDKPDTVFTTVGGTEYITLDPDATTGTQNVTYSVTGQFGGQYTDYIEIEIPYMPKGNDTDGYASYGFNFNWMSADPSVTADTIVAIAVYSVDAD